MLVLAVVLAAVFGPLVLLVAVLWLLRTPSTRFQQGRATGRPAPGGAPGRPASAAPAWTSLADPAATLGSIARRQALETLRSLATDYLVLRRRDAA